VTEREPCERLTAYEDAQTGLDDWEDGDDE